MERGFQLRLAFCVGVGVGVVNCLILLWLAAVIAAGAALGTTAALLLSPLVGWVYGCSLTGFIVNRKCFMASFRSAL